MINNTCHSCGITFTKRNNPNRVYKFCTKKCAGIAFKKEKEIKKCAECGSGFPVWPYEIRDERRFCSVKCHNKNKDNGKTTQAFRVRTSRQYAAWRVAVFERDGYRCQLCGVVGGKLNADHIKRFSDYPELRLSVDNGRTLCVPCHLATDNFGNRKLASNVLAVGQEA